MNLFFLEWEHKIGVHKKNKCRMANCFVLFQFDRQWNKFNLIRKNLSCCGWSRQPKINQRGPKAEGENERVRLDEHGKEITNADTLISELFRLLHWFTEQLEVINKNKTHSELGVFNERTNEMLGEREKQIKTENLDAWIAVFCCSNEIDLHRSIAKETEALETSREKCRTTNNPTIDFASAARLLCTLHT